MTTVIVDSKLIAYRSVLQRFKDGIYHTLIDLNDMLKYLVKSDILKGEYEVVIGFDFGKSRYRKELLSTYKGHRTEGLAEKPEAEQIRFDKFQNDYRHELPKFCDAMGLRYLGVEGVEFDDLGSILAHKVNSKVLIVSDDHDLQQIVLAMPKKVRQFFTRDYKLIAPLDITEIERGVKNKGAFLMKKCLLGDSGDGIKKLIQFGKVAYDEWFEEFKDSDYTKDEWRGIFIEVAQSKPKYKLPSDYPVVSFAQLFDLNWALGETMTGFQHLNKDEIVAYQLCMTKDLHKDIDEYRRLMKAHGYTAKSEFGDLQDPPDLEYLYGN